MCFSIQGQPDFAFNLINDKYIQLNGQFVLPTDSHTIANVSTFLGDLGLMVKDPETGNSTIIEVSAHNHSIRVGSSLTIVKDKPVTVDVSNAVSISIDNNDQTSKTKDEAAWLYINTNSGFGLKVRFYREHLDMFFTKTSAFQNLEQLHICSISVLTYTILDDHQIQQQSKANATLHKNKLPSKFFLATDYIRLEQS